MGTRAGLAGDTLGLVALRATAAAGAGVEGLEEDACEGVLFVDAPLRSAWDFAEPVGVRLSLDAVKGRFDRPPLLPVL